MMRAGSLKLLELLQQPSANLAMIRLARHLQSRLQQWIG